MTKSNTGRVGDSGQIPNDPNPYDGKGIPFSVYIEGSSSFSGPRRVLTRTEFNPVYYPDRYSDTLKREVKRDDRQCGGEDVTVDKSKNPEFHATGIVLAGNVSDFREVRRHDGPVNLVTPLTDNEGGMEVVVTKGEIGELVGWDNIYNQWQFNYTLDMVASGRDTDEGGRSQVVSEVIESQRRRPEIEDVPDSLSAEADEEDTVQL